ncbi:MAG: hypothetical protein WCG42_06165 [Parachlamydiaceae bacterium]
MGKEHEAHSNITVVNTIAQVSLEEVATTHILKPEPMKTALLQELPLEASQEPLSVEE